MEDPLDTETERKEIKHACNNHLASILLYIETLVLHLPSEDEKVAKLVRELQAEVKRLRDRVNSL